MNFKLGKVENGQRVLLSQPKIVTRPGESAEVYQETPGSPLSTIDFKVTPHL